MKKGPVIVVVVLVIIALGVGVLWFVGNRSLTDKTTNELGFIKVTQKDTDNDGLSDELETLWQTDPKNPDTNNDGIADGNSIQQNIDPVKAGSEPIEGVDQRLQALIQNAITAKGAPLIDVSPTAIPAALVFKESDLHTTTTETVATVTKYRDDLRQALLTYGSDLNGEEINYLVNFMDTGNESDIVRLSLEKTKYENLLRALADVTVPKSATQLHLNMLNNLAQIYELVNFMSKVKSEPLLAIKSSQLIYQRNDEFFRSLNLLNGYFIKRND